MRTVSALFGPSHRRVFDVQGVGNFGRGWKGQGVDVDGPTSSLDEFNDVFLVGVAMIEAIGGVSSRDDTNVEVIPESLL